MKVSYVTMQFPAPSEVFASNDVRWLRRHLDGISVHSMRFPAKTHDELLEQRGLAGVRVTSASWGSAARGMLHALGRPGLLARATAWLWRNSRRSRGELAKALLLLPRGFDILRELERERPDVVHVYWGHYPALVGWLVQEAMPETATSIGFVAYDLEQEWGGSRDVARRAQLVRTSARSNVEHVARAYGVPADQVEVIYDGIDLERIERLSRGREKVSGRMAIVARMTERKGIFEAVEVVARLRATHPQAHLRVLGDGPDLPRLRARARELGVEDAVHFLGHVDHDTVIEELAAAQVLLLPTRAYGERLPNVVKEGMACGCICITSYTTGLEELVEHERTGFVIPWQDIDAMSSVAARVMEGDPALEPVRERAREHVYENFGLAGNCARYLELWQQSLGRQAGRPATREETPPELATT